MSGVALRHRSDARPSAPARPLRIAFVSDGVWPYNMGGKEKRLYEITRYLAAQGYDVHVYTMKWWRGGPTTRHGEVWLHALSKYHPMYKGERRSIGQALRFGVATLRLLREPFDVLDVDHMPLFPLLGARLVCTIRRKPLFGTWHEVWGKEYWRSYLGPSGLFGHVAERISLHMPDTIISDSHHTTERLHHSRQDLVVATVPLGVDLEHIEQIEPSAIVSDVVFAGRLLKHKNVDLLLEAVHRLRRQHPAIRCVVMGDGPERTRLEELVGHLGCSAIVRFLGFVEDHDEVLAVMKSSKVFVLPSEREGFGLVVLEANACDLPIVAVRHRDNAAERLVVEGQNGFLADLDSADLAAQIERCLTAEPPLRPKALIEERLGELGWSQVAERVGKILSGTTRERRSLGRGRACRVDASASS